MLNNQVLDPLKLPQTLTPEVLLAIAKINKKFPIPEATTDILASRVERSSAILGFKDNIFGESFVAFYEAVSSFLQINNFLPEVPEEKKEELVVTGYPYFDEDFDSLDMIDERNG